MDHARRESGQGIEGNVVRCCVKGVLPCEDWDEGLGAMWSVRVLYIP